MRRHPALRTWLHCSALWLALAGCKPKTIPVTFTDGRAPLANVRVRLLSEEELERFLAGRGAPARDKFLELQAAWLAMEKAMVGKAFDVRPAPRVIAKKDDVEVLEGTGDELFRVYTFTYDSSLHTEKGARLLAGQALDEGGKRGDLGGRLGLGLVHIAERNRVDWRPLAAKAQDEFREYEGEVFDALDAPALADGFTDDKGTIRLPLPTKAARVALVAQATFTLNGVEARHAWALWLPGADHEPLQFDPGSLLTSRPGSTLIALPQ